MKMLLALLLLPAFVRADEISDRETRNAERLAAESRARTAAYRQQGNNERLVAFNGWIQNHGGLISGTCSIGMEDCSDRSRYDRSDYCPVRNSGQQDIRSLGASAEYVIWDCRVHTRDGSACTLSPDSERNSYPKGMGHWKATCTPEGGTAYLLTFGPNGREYKAAPIKEVKEKPEKSYSYSRGYYGYGYYPYGYYGYGGRVNNYNCYGENCNYYGVGKHRRKRH